MKDFLRKIFSGIVVGLGLMVGVLVIPGVYAGSLSLFTGPGTATTSVQFPAALRDLNTLINNINSTVAPGGTGTPRTNFLITGGLSNPGLVQFAGTGAWTANGTVAVTTTSLGPTGASTTIVKWFTVRDDTGALRYVPAY